MFNPRDIIDLLAANVRKSRNPFGAPSSRFNTWWREAGGFTRRPGDALLFTGLMYQVIPYLEATTRRLESLEGSRWADYLKYGRFLPGSLLGQGFAFLTSKEDRKKFNGILLSIYRLLKKSGVDFFYHPEMDFYSGILLYDLGDQESFVDCFDKGIAGIIIMSCGVESPYPGSYEALAKRIDRVYPLMKAKHLDIRRLRLTAICTVCTRAFLNEVKQMNDLVTELGPPGRERPAAGAA